MFTYFIISNLSETLSPKSILISILLFFLFLSLNGCGSRFPESKEFIKSYALLNQDSSKVVFPNDFKNKIVVMGFMFTNCPDVCPLTTNKMRLIQEKVKDEGLEDIEFAELSFDPMRDKPWVLKKYAEIRDLDMHNFQFLTGEDEQIKSILKRVNVVAYAEDTTYTDEGEPIYFFMHTDRIILIDREGNIRKEYPGSHIDINEITEDIKHL
ncbi:MAG TPA: SCO family protein [Ignavibacteriaceae bacterium]|nr:SCO family protein [Ignavibacteriaceae bacterium]